jgi:hypothetical protein
MADSFLDVLWSSVQDCAGAGWDPHHLSVPDKYCSLGEFRCFRLVQIEHRIASCPRYFGFCELYISSCGYTHAPMGVQLIACKLFASGTKSQELSVNVVLGES